MSKSASADEIKKAYRSLSKEWHPDKHKGDKGAEDKFKEINQAYEILSDPEKKSQYDRFGTSGNQGGFGAGGFDFSNMNFGGQGMPDLEDLFGSFFGGGRRQQPSGRGDDIEVATDLTLQEVLTGVERTMRLRRLLPCETCDGSGGAPGSSVVTCTECGGTGNVTKRSSSFFGTIEQRVRCARCGGSGKFPETPCGDCQGEGRKEKTADVTVRIPAGVMDGQTLRVTGAGGGGRRGEQAGDLYVHIRVKSDSRFVREDNDIHTSVALHVLQATLGDEIDVETLHGTVRLKIPDGTQPGQILRIKGKGLPSVEGGRMGDHHVHVDIEIPKKLSRAEKKILEEWKAARG